MKEDLILEQMYELDSKATKALFEKIKDTEGVELVCEYDDSAYIRFTYKGHTYIFTAELED